MTLLISHGALTKPRKTKDANRVPLGGKLLATERLLTTHTLLRQPGRHLRGESFLESNWLPDGYQENTRFAPA